MPETTQENGVPAEIPQTTAVPASDTNPPAAPETAVPATESVGTHKAALAENELESAHADALPLSQIGGEETQNNTPKKHQNNGHRGLRRGNRGRADKNGVPATQQPGPVENTSEVKETLSGSGFNKPRRQRFQNEKPADKVIDKNIENARESGNWRVEEAVSEPRKFHPQSNVDANNGKLHIEPAPLPVQEKEPSVFAKLWSKVCGLFGVKFKKKNKKSGKKFDGKFDGKRRDFKNKKFRKGGDFRRNGYRKNFRRYDNNGSGNFRNNKKDQ